MPMGSKFRQEVDLNGLKCQKFEWAHFKLEVAQNVK